jgi:hypothetical protein
MQSSKTRFLEVLSQTLLTIYISLWVIVSAADEKVLGSVGVTRKGYAKGDWVPVSCLNRTV